jgi:lactoylglutathione lyase
MHSFSNPYNTCKNPLIFAHRDDKFVYKETYFFTEGAVNMIYKTEHIGIKVKNMDISIKFYTEVLTLELVDRVRLNAEVELAFLSFPGHKSVQIELIGRGHEGLPNESVVHHLALTVSNIEAEVERLKTLGVKLIDEQPRDILDGVKIAFFYGPDGEQLEFFQPKTPGK